MAPIQKCYDVKISAPGVSCRRCGGSSKRSWDTFLPIARRGSFFQDSFFANIQHDFDAAVRDVLNRWSDDDLTLTDRRSHSDIMGRYRQLRSRNRKEENQAITVTSDSSSHKVRRSHTLTQAHKLTHTHIMWDIAKLILFREVVLNLCSLTANQNPALLWHSNSKFREYRNMNVLWKIKQQRKLNKLKSME